MISGVLALLQGDFHYHNYWHAPVFAPFALLVGAFAVILAIRGRRS